jgi:predicted DNA-binding ribbon-helix-helix protein
MASNPNHPPGPPMTPGSRRSARPRTKTKIGKRSVNIDGQPTSVSLEDGFWNALREIAAAQNTTAQQLVLKINSERTHGNLSSVVRQYILSYYREQRDAKGLSTPPALR